MKLMMPNEESIYIYAARYAHTRRTGAALQVVNEILNNWYRFSKQAQQQIVREAKHDATENLSDWKKLIDHLTEER